MNLNQHHMSQDMSCSASMQWTSFMIAWLVALLHPLPRDSHDSVIFKSLPVMRREFLNLTC